MEVQFRELVNIRDEAIILALDNFTLEVKSTPNILGDKEEIEFIETESGILVIRGTSKAFISYFEVDTLVQDTVTFDGGVYLEHQIGAISDTLLEELERWRNHSKRNVLLQEIE